MVVVVVLQRNKGGLHTPTRERKKTKTKNINGPHYEECAAEWEKEGNRKAERIGHIPLYFIQYSSLELSHLWERGEK